MATLPFALNVSQGNFAAAGGTLYFTTTSGFQSLTRGQLWRSDGTEAGTSQVIEFPSGGGAGGAIPKQLVDAGGRLFLMVTDAFGSGGRLWTSDGMPGGTVPLKRFTTNNFAIGPLVAAGDRVFVAGAGKGDTGGVELWASDGTPAGTARVKDINPGAASSSPLSPRASGPTVYFSALEPTGGRELWKTDGTEAGTLRVADLKPGTAGSEPTVLAATGGRVYFTADDGVHGRELWSADGTAGGTILIYDVRPGAAGSGAAGVLPVNLPGAALLFRANDGVHGIEPWIVPPPLPLPSFVLGRHLFYNNSRFDGRSAAANEADDGAIAPDRQALLPGATPSFADVSGYSRGLNGLMVDLDKRLDFITGDRFTFRVGWGGAVGNSTVAPAPLSVIRRDGPGGTERVSFTWADGAIRNAWLEVTVDVLSGDRVVGTDVFFYGSLPGETGRGAGPGAVLRVDAGAAARRTAPA